MMMEQPPVGYPPPTLIRKRSRFARARQVVLLLTVALVLGTCTVNRFITDAKPEAAPAPVAPPAPVDEAGAGSADAAPATLPDSAAPQVTIDAPADNPAPAKAGPDARQPNQWYYVRALGDGPAAIYSRNGAQWSYAFACTSKTHMIEFIAVGTGSPGSFDQQAMSVGPVRLMMDATYSKDGGGTISTRLPATHALFDRIDGKTPMEVQLFADRKTILPIGDGVVRLVRACRGNG